MPRRAEASEEEEKGACTYTEVSIAQEIGFRGVGGS